MCLGSQKAAAVSPEAQTGEKSAFAIGHPAHHNPALSLKSSTLSILLLLLCSDLLMSEFEFLQKCRWFMWEVIPGGTVGRGQ